MDVLIRVIWKLGMKFASISIRRGRREYFVKISMLCYMTPSHRNTHPVRGRPKAKMEIRRFRKGLVHELKVNKKEIVGTVKLRHYV